VKPIPQYGAFADTTPSTWRIVVWVIAGDTPDVRAAGPANQSLKIEKFPLMRGGGNRWKHDVEIQVFRNFFVAGLRWFRIDG
jgi:hypothetical protein